jgi:transcriptional regulator with XRE-family HTH domain
MQQRTLQEVADYCGFSKSLLSKIENGKTLPPVATLVKIAEALGVKVSTLLDETEPAGPSFTTYADIAHADLVRTSKGYSFFVFAADRPHKRFQPFLFEAKRGDVSDQPLSHSGEEFIYVIEGSMEYRVGSVTYTLHPGDSLYFDSEQLHDLRPLTDTVRYLGVFSEREDLENETGSSSGFPDSGDVPRYRTS